MQGSWIFQSGIDTGKATYHSYVYAEGHPIADLKRDSTLFLKSLALDTTQATRITEERTTEDEYGYSSTYTVTVG